MKDSKLSMIVLDRRKPRLKAGFFIAKFSEGLTYSRQSKISGHSSKKNFLASGSQVMRRLADLLTGIQLWKAGPKGEPLSFFAICLIHK